MPEQRHVYRVGKSLVVALPPQVREHLGVDRGGAVFWHLVRGKEAVLTKRERRAGGHPEGLALSRQLDGARAEVERLRRKLQARPLRLLHEGASIYAGQVMRESIPVEARLQLILNRLDSIEARLPRRRASRRASAAPATASSEQLDPGPSSSPSGDAAAGESAASGGAAPQAAHL